jgi:hypothetical protein
MMRENKDMLSGNEKYMIDRIERNFYMVFNYKEYGQYYFWDEKKGEAECMDYMGLRSTYELT